MSTPNLFEKSRKSSYLGMYLSRPDMERLDQLAQRAETTRSEVVRRLLHVGFAEADRQLEAMGVAAGSSKTG